MKEKKDTFWNLILSILAAGTVALLSNAFVNTNSLWYNSLLLPAFYPPNIVFAIVWSIVYILFAGIIFYLLQNGKFTRDLTAVFIGNGILNVAWTLGFFTLQNVSLGLGIIIANLIFAGTLTYLLFKQNKTVGFISLIYLAWLAFATTLNAFIFVLN